MSQPLMVPTGSSRGLQSWGFGPVLVYRLLGSGPHSRRGAVGETQTLPTTSRVCGKIVFHETSPWCPRSGDHCRRVHSAPQPWPCQLLQGADAEQPPPMT